MIVDCISDLHGYHPELQGGDLLIVAGDCTARDNGKQWMDFVCWLCRQKYKKIIVIGGNHDVCLKYNDEVCVLNTDSDSNIQYLCNTSTEFMGFKIYGAPWNRYCSGMNKDCQAFTYKTDTQMMEEWEKIPLETDILITHTPPRHVLDKSDIYLNRLGCPELYKRLKRMWELGSRIKLHVFGHIHEGYGIETDGIYVETSVNAAIMDVNYNPTNKPIRVVL